MNAQERQALIDEQQQLEKEVATADLVSPKVIRRIDEIRSLLMSDGERSDIIFKKGTPSGSSFVVRSMANVSNKRRR